MHGGQGHGTKEMKELKKENMRKNEEFKTTNGEKNVNFTLLMNLLYNLQKLILNYWYPMMVEQK